MLHDLVVTAAAILATFYVRFEGEQLDLRLNWLGFWLPAFVIYAGAVYFAFRMHESKWRFTSMPELLNIVRASAVLAGSLLVLDYILLAPNFFGTFYFGKISIALYWLMQMAFLAGPRIVYRYFRYTRTQRQVHDSSSEPTLILGRAADTEVPLRAIESGSVHKIWPVGILSPARSDLRAAIRGVPVLGGFDDFDHVLGLLKTRGTTVARLLLTPSAFEPGVGVEKILMQARRIGLTASRLPSLDEGGEALRLAPVAVEDLLLRDSVAIDYARIENFIRGKSIVVTGGGGSIGSEICDRIATFKAARLLVIENSEPALHAALERLSGKFGAAQVDGRIADVRDRERMFQLLKDFKPDIVFHAAALKHVPLLERDWGEAIKTNVFGSMNVADAAAAAQASAMVMISTDKAIEPVSMLGATKRFAEMYCQALDAEFARKADGGRPPMRLIAVRFGNVLASNGSVVPKFKAQIEAGGPITVTHPDMMRYFMTIREACDLVVTAASHALDRTHNEVSLYVLNMGQPIKILDLARRMVQLSGLEPGRDLEIVFTGVRPGERLHEILFARNEPTAEIGVAGIVAATPVCPAIATMETWKKSLAQGLATDDRDAIYRVLGAAVPDFRGDAA